MVGNVTTDPHTHLELSGPSYGFVTDFFPKITEIGGTFGGPYLSRHEFNVPNFLQV